MLKGVFPRLFGNFREGALVHAKFVVSAGPIYTLKSNQGNANYPLTLVKGAGAGRLFLTLTGGARNIALVSAFHVPISAAGVNLVDIFFRNPAIVESTGVLDLICLKVTDESNVDPSATDELHFILYIDK